MRRHTGFIRVERGRAAEHLEASRLHLHLVEAPRLGLPGGLEVLVEHVLSKLLGDVAGEAPAYRVFAIGGQIRRVRRTRP